jgi:hypothetical protein
MLRSFLFVAPMLISRCVEAVHNVNSMGRSAFGSFKCGKGCMHCPHHSVYFAGYLAWLNFSVGAWIECRSSSYSYLAQS